MHSTRISQKASVSNMSATPLAVAASTIQAGMGIFIPSGPVGEHLFVVVGDIEMIDGREKILLAPIESLLPKSDQSCLLNVGDYEFIQRPSHIGYRHCRSDDVSHVQACLKSGTFRLAKTNVSSALLARIRLGYKSSSQVPRYIKSDWNLV